MQYFHTIINLLDYGARWYSASLGRFTQPDTIVPNLTETQSWNRYTYTINNPITFNDPSGHSICSGDGWCLGDYLVGNPGLSSRMDEEWNYPQAPAPSGGNSSPLTDDIDYGQYPNPNNSCIAPEYLVCTAPVEDTPDVENIIGDVATNGYMIGEFIYYYSDLDILQKNGLWYIYGRWGTRDYFFMNRMTNRITAGNWSTISPLQGAYNGFYSGGTLVGLVNNLAQNGPYFTGSTQQRVENSAALLVDTSATVIEAGVSGYVGAAAAGIWGGPVGVGVAIITTFALDAIYKNYVREEAIDGWVEIVLPDN